MPAMAVNDQERKVCDALAARGEAMLRDLAAHIAIPTGSGHQSGLDHYRSLLIDRLKAAPLGAEIELVPGSPRPDWLTLPGKSAQKDHTPPPVVLARHHTANDAQRILIAGHIDTVHDPHGPFQKLAIAPDGLTATGPGAADMKGGIVIALHALEALEEQNVGGGWTFLLNSDEETGSFHSFDALQTAARQHDIGLALEPALPDGSLVIERMGAGQFKIEVFGRSAHVGREFARGISAVNRLAEIISEVAAFSDPAPASATASAPAPPPGIIVNIGPLLGGAVTNAVPDYAACWGNVRYKDRAMAAELEKRFDALRTAPDALPRIDVHCLFNRPAKPLTPQVQALADRARATAADLDQTLSFASTGGVCDGNILQDAGLPTIDTLGVRGGNLHRTDEYIELPSLIERAQLLAVLMMRLAH